MREAIIVCPKLGNKGEDISPAHNTLRNALLNFFGGYRVRDAFGAWQSPTGQLFEEECREYIVAFEDTPRTNDVLKALAIDFRIDAKQESVYYRLPSGEVFFV